MKILFEDAQEKIYCGDVLDLLRQCDKVALIFLDPPDNLGLAYDEFKDVRADYYDNLELVLRLGLERGKSVLLSYYHAHDLEIKYRLAVQKREKTLLEVRTLIWRFTFGQYRTTDLASGFRPILRIRNFGHVLNLEEIKMVSSRTLSGDKRAASEDRVPDDVSTFDAPLLDIPRVTGNHRERRAWHPTQHPEALLSYLVRMMTKEGDTVLDGYMGTGSLRRVCKTLNRRYIGIDISENYVNKVLAE